MFHIIFSCCEVKSFMRIIFLLFNGMIFLMMLFIKIKNMKPLGIILIVVGILMLIFTNVSFTTEKKVVDLGPVEINKKEKKTVDWPSYAGGIAVVSGIVVLLVSKRKA